MKSVVQTCLCLPVLMLAAQVASAQAKPTATRSLAPTAFVLATGTATGVGAYQQAEFQGGKNLGITAGLDVGFHSFGRYLLAAEVRGTYPFKSGTFVGERSILGGARISMENNTPFRPYVDALFGRGQMDYQKGGYLIGNLLYTRTASNVYGGGGGVEVDVSQHFSVKVDAQAQHWSTPVVTNGSVWSKQVSLGVAYRIGAGGGPR